MGSEAGWVAGGNGAATAVANPGVRTSSGDAVLPRYGFVRPVLAGLLALLILASAACGPALTAAIASPSARPSGLTAIEMLRAIGPALEARYHEGYIRSAKNYSALSPDGRAR